MFVGRRRPSWRDSGGEEEMVIREDQRRSRGIRGIRGGLGKSQCTASSCCSLGLPGLPAASTMMQREANNLDRLPRGRGEWHARGNDGPRSACSHGHANVPASDKGSSPTRMGSQWRAGRANGRQLSARQAKGRQLLGGWPAEGVSRCPGVQVLRCPGASPGGWWVVGVLEQDRWWQHQAVPPPSPADRHADATRVPCVVILWLTARRLAWCAHGGTLVTSTTANARVEKARKKQRRAPSCGTGTDDCPEAHEAPPPVDMHACSAVGNCFGDMGGKPGSRTPHAGTTAGERGGQEEQPCLLKGRGQQQPAPTGVGSCRMRQRTEI